MPLPELTIRLYGDPCLRKKSTPVAQVGPGERMLIRAMFKTMLANKGIGLAAPQVGVNHQIFVADIGQGQDPVAVINPKILSRSGSTEMEEGCLSIPGVGVKIRRAQTIQVEFTDENNQRVTAEFSDLMARVFLHENDHIHGRLIVDHASEQERAAMKKKLDALTRKAKAALA